MTPWIQIVLLQGGTLLVTATAARFILARGLRPPPPPSSVQGYRSPHPTLSAEAIAPTALALITEGVHRTVQTLLTELAFEGHLAATAERERVQVARVQSPGDPLVSALLARVSTKMAPDETVSRIDLYNVARDVVIERKGSLLDEAARHGLCASRARRRVVRTMLGLAALGVCGIGVWAVAAGQTVLGLLGAVVALGLLGYFWNRHGGEQTTRRWREDLVTATSELRQEVRSGKRHNPRDAALAVALEGTLVIVHRPEFAAMAPPRPTRLDGSPYNDGQTPL